jgi:hypothetical protein
MSSPEASQLYSFPINPWYMGADKSLARPRRKQAAAIEDFDFRVSYL